jgi:hypothetical protein
MFDAAFPRAAETTRRATHDVAALTELALRETYQALPRSARFEFVDLYQDFSAMMTCVGVKQTAAYCDSFSQSPFDNFPMCRVRDHEL